MDQGYEVYCLADPTFYDSPWRVRGDDVDFDIAASGPPEGWHRSELDDWLEYRPAQLRLPPQGWKIHVSACMDNVESVLGTIVDYCTARQICFKFVRSRQLFFIRNTKYAHRGSSGKFATIYPTDDAQLRLVLAELGALLDGQPGPYILSDLRIGAGPLYVRYGGFAERYCVGADGQQVLAIADPDGRLVPDPRRPTFQPPSWVTLPDFLANHLAARNATTVEDLPYRIDRALHFSNGGGLYAGIELQTGDEVVLKEARPNAGLAWNGEDAVSRLRREKDILDQLAGLDVVPAAKGSFTVGEHHFLVEEFVDGRLLSALLVERYPLVLPDPGEAVLAEYTAWALDTYQRVDDAVAAIHARGVVIGDLHPYNVIVRPDERITMIDFETAALVSEQRRPTLAAPGFTAPPGRTGFDIDHYAMACLRLFLFLPLQTLIGFAPDKAEQFAAIIAQAFPVPSEFLSEAVRIITGPAAVTACEWPTIDPSPVGWQQARKSMEQAILASATPDRDDRLFPGDVQQFATGGLNLAYGAAGVLYALAATGSRPDPQHEEWLVRRATHPQLGTRFGFYDGLHGVAYVLHELDRSSDALKVLDICVGELHGKWDQLGLDLFGGLVGVGLNLAHFATASGDPSLFDETWQVAQLVADRLGDEKTIPEISGGRHPRAGLLRGSSGAALLFLRLYEQRRDEALLDLAATALRQDLRRCYRRDDGSLEVNEGWRTMPYLSDGSVGIGLVLTEYLTHRDDEAFVEAAAAIHRAAEAQFYIEPGLFSGRAGMILCLSHGRAPGAAGRDPVVAAQIRRLAWHALTYRGHLAFPGDQLLRLSMDLATGTAGVLLAVGAALHDQPVHLPFLGPRDGT